MGETKTYTKADKKRIITSICEIIIDGKSLRTALNDINVKIPAVTFFDWIDKDSELAKQYTRATVERAQMMFEDMMDIADENPRLTDTKFGTAVDTGDVQNKHLRVEARKWAMAKMMPKKYGAKAEQVEESENNTPTIKIEYVSNERTKPKNSRKVR